MDLAAGARIDRFILIEPLGEGGQGSVWKAQDPLDPEEPRALKLVRLLHSKPNAVERVRREARALARLSHPSLVRCHGLFEDVTHELLGLTMDFVDGTALGELARDPRFSFELRAKVLGHVARALSYVHRQGVVHRDLKLENVLVSHAFWGTPDQPESVKLVDFGIAAQEGNPHPLTALDSVIGTLAYLAPELLDPAYFGQQGSTPRVDVFAFGVLAWKLLSGSEHPTGLGPRASIVEYGMEYRRIAEHGARWPEAAPEGPWGTLIAECLRVRPEERIENAEQLAERCEQAAPRSARVVHPEKPLSGKAELTAVDSPGAMLGRTAAVGRAVEPAPAARPAAVRQGAAPMPALEERDAAGTAASRLGAEPPAAAPPRTRPSAGRRSVWPLAAGSVLVAGIAGAGATWFAISGNRGTPPPLPQPSAPASPESAALALVPEPGADAGDAATDAPLEAGDRPSDCAPDASLCTCCPSGRDCSPGSCKDDLDPATGFRLRVGRVTSAGRDLAETRPDAEICVRVVGGDQKWTCTPLKSRWDAGMNQRLYVETIDLAVRGLSILIRDASAPNVALATRHVVRWDNGLTRRELCSGLLVGGLVGPLEVDSFRLYLDPDPPLGQAVHCPGS